MSELLNSYEQDRVVAVNVVINCMDAPSRIYVYFRDGCGFREI